MLRAHFYLLPLSVAALLLAPPARASDGDDVVMPNNGGRLRGLVIEEGPVVGLRIKLLDGTMRTLKPADVKEVRYHDSTTPSPAAAAVPPSVSADPSAATTVSSPVAEPPVSSAPPVPDAVHPPVGTLPYPTSNAARRSERDRASAAAEHRLEFGVRLAFGLAMGNEEGGGTTTNPNGSTATLSEVPLSGLYSYRAPVLFELNYAVSSKFVIGAYVQYARDVWKSGGHFGCASGLDCTGHDIEAGIQAQLHLGFGQRVGER